MGVTRRVITCLAGFASHAVLAAILTAVTVEVAVRSTPLVAVDRLSNTARLVTASDGSILWAFRSTDDRWRLSIGLNAIDPGYLDLLVATEDRRFWSHHGVDVAALVRAAYQAVRHGRAASGASTITMQVVRLLEPRPRTFAGKLGEIFRALRLERSLSKTQVLRAYLTLAPFGGSIEGIRSASLIYLGKEPARLSAAEAALMVAIPQSPETRRPDRHPGAARAARDRLLAAAAADGRLLPGAARVAADTPVPARVHPLARLAPHLAMRLARAAPHDQLPLTTLVDPALQSHVEAVASRAVAGWSDQVSVAALVIRNRDGAVVSYLGGADLQSYERRGFLDLVQAVRSPGSALKPFIYALAFEKLLVHPETIVSDRPVDIGGYRPDNADGVFLGDLTVRQALVRSRNTTAVALLDRLGVGMLLARFRSAGRALQLPGPESTAGLAVALGGAGVSLEGLTFFYSALANEGRLPLLRWRTTDRAGSAGDLMTAAAARATADILADVPPPPGFARSWALDGGRRIGFKTGTSYGFRDAWAVGFDRLHTVGVWVGRADGAAHLGAYGATAAAPIMLRIFDRLPLPDGDVSPPRIGHVDLSSARELPPRLQRFSGGGRDGIEPRLEIVFPKTGAELDVDRGSRTTVGLPLTVSGGRSPFTWTLNGKRQTPTTSTTMTWPVSETGQLEVSVTDVNGAVASSSFWLR